MGKITSDQIQCPYHGLVFDMDGNCIHNPHGNGKCPSSLKVQTYPVTLSDDIVGVWMGDQE
jgi:vanillate O-demethylase monooxygenase subunit